MIILQHRGGFVETTHPAHAVAVRMDGAFPRTLFEDGAPVRSPWRSAGKPFQLLTSLQAMPDGDAAFRDEELAIGASSHSGQPLHTDHVLALLRRFGFDAHHLRCGAEPPAHGPTHEALLAAGLRPSDLHNDCSGKHAFMLGAVAANSWALDYRPTAHPLQARNIAAVETLASEAPGIAVDGCGVPTFVLSLSGMARAWAALAFAMAEPERDPLLSRIGHAMARHPLLTSGEGRIDLAIAERATEPFVGKIGAQGVFCVALPARRLGVAIKVTSGDDAALAVAVPALLDRIAPGALRPDAGAWPWADVRNVVGAVVGQRLVADTSRA